MKTYESVLTGEKVELYKYLTKQDISTLEKMKIIIGEKAYSYEEYSKYKDIILKWPNGEKSYLDLGINKEDFFEAFKDFVNIEMNYYKSVPINFHNELFPIRNIYEKLSKNDLEILKKINANLENKEYNYQEFLSMMSNLKIEMKRVNESKITNDEFISAFKNFSMSRDKFFTEDDINKIMLKNEYPNTKYNIFLEISKENMETMKKIGIIIENREYTAKEYADIDGMFCDLLMNKFGTNIKKKDCEKLYNKIESIYWNI